MLDTASLGAHLELPSFASILLGMYRANNVFML